MKEQLLVIGVDALDWATFRSLLAAGRLPAIGALAGSGVAGRLACPMPPGGVAAWATIATGLMPTAHGVCHSEEAWAGGLRPAGAASWRRRPIWHRLAEAGVPTISVGWQATRPGTAWRDVQIDDRLGEVSGLSAEDWPLPLDIAPAAWRETIREARVHVADLPAAALAPLGAPSPALAEHVARLATLHAVGRALMERAPWPLGMIQLDWLSAAAATLGTKIAELPASACALLDGAVASLAKTAPAETTVLIVSPGTPGRAGVLVVAGRVAAGNAPAASVLDVAPTIAARFGWGDPAFPGRPLFPRKAPLRPLPADPTASDRAAVPADTADLERVATWGHSPPAPPPGWPAPRLLAEAELLLPNDPAAASALADEALALCPDWVPALGLAATACFALGDAARLAVLAERLQARAPAALWTIMARAGVHVLRGEAAAARPLLLAAETVGGPDERLRVGAAGMLLGCATDARRVFERLVQERPEQTAPLLGLASVAQRPAEVERLLRCVLTIDPTHAGARNGLGDLLRSQGRAREARAIG